MIIELDGERARVTHIEQGKGEFRICWYVVLSMEGGDGKMFLFIPRIEFSEESLRQALLTEWRKLKQAFAARKKQVEEEKREQEKEEIELAALRRIAGLGERQPSPLRLPV